MAVDVLTHSDAAARSVADAAFERLYTQYANRVFSYCRRQLGGRTEAEDAAQNVFLHALRGLRRGIVPQAESAWLFTIAHNVCRTYWRGAPRRRQGEDQRGPHVLQEGVAQRGVDGDELFGPRGALAGISEAQRRGIPPPRW